MTQKYNTTKGDLAKQLLKMKNEGNFDTDKLIELITSQEDFLQSIASQSTRALYRQLLKLFKDFIPSEESVSKAKEAGAISEEFANALIDNYTALEESFTGSKADNLGYLMASPNKSGGFINHLTKSLTDFNTWVKHAAEQSRQIKNSFEFDIRLASELPEHRLNDTIINLFEFDYYSISGIVDSSTVEKGNAHVQQPQGTVVPEASLERMVPEANQAYMHQQNRPIHFIPYNEAEMYNLGTKVEVSYDKAKKIVTVKLNVISLDSGINNTTVSLMVNPAKTASNFIKAFDSQYLINSAVIIPDFPSETALIDTLYIKPLAELMDSTLDSTLTSNSKRLRFLTQDVKKALTETRNEQNEINRNNPLLEAYLSIVEDGVDSTQNKGETVSRISKAEVLKKLFQDRNEKYEATISKTAPAQTGLDRRFSIFRADFGDNEVIDFVVMEYGLRKQKIWLPIDKTFIADAVAVNTWNTFGTGGNDEIIRKSNTSDSMLEETFISISSNQFNPSIT